MSLCSSRAMQLQVLSNYPVLRAARLSVFAGKITEASMMSPHHIQTSAFL